MGWGYGNIGGGAGLNFKVVGVTSQPANPSENTIWVDTDTAISSWIFSATEPDNPTAGLVWFETAAYSENKFNAIKKNGIIVYPIGCKQYDGSAWVLKEAKTYDSGAWKDWFEYVYKAGETNVLTAIGWKATSGTVYTHVPTVSYGADGTTISPTGDKNASSGAAYFKKKYDLTNKSVLEADVTLSGTSSDSALHINGVYVWSAVNSGYFYDNAAAKAGMSEYGSATLTVDVSNLSGEYYIGFGHRRMNNGPTLKFSEVRLK